MLGCCSYGSCRTESALSQSGSNLINLRGEELDASHVTTQVRNNCKISAARCRDHLVETHSSDAEEDAQELTL
jgi:hypothetical protein